MTSRHLLLLVAAVAALAAGLWLANSRSSGPTPGSELLYPQLKNELDAITTVRVWRAGSTPAVTLQRQDGRWQVAERRGYPADATKLRRLLLALADARMFEAKTANPAQYAVLGVQDITATNADGLQVELEGTAHPYRLIIGKRGPGRDTHFVRRAGEAQSWLVDAALDPGADPAQWLHREVLNIAADRIQSAQISVGKARSYTASKQSRADESFAVDDLPRGKALKSADAADGFATALSTVTLTDALPADAITSPDTQSAARSIFKTFDGLVVHAQGYRDGDHHYVTLNTTFDATHAARFKLPSSAADGTPEGIADAAGSAIASDSSNATAAADTQFNGDAETIEPPQPATSTDPGADAPLQVEQESQRLNQQLAGWAFEIPAFKYEALFQPVETLID